MDGRSTNIQIRQCDSRRRGLFVHGPWSLVSSRLLKKRFDLIIVSPLRTAPSRCKATAAEKAARLAPEVIIPARQTPVTSEPCTRQDLSQEADVDSHVEEGARAVEEHVLLDQVLARHGREHRTGLLGVEPEVVDEVA